MSDFLGALARRAVMAPTIRPRIASSFGDGGWQERSEQVEFSAPRPSAPSLQAAMGEVAPHPRHDAALKPPPLASEQPRARWAALPDASLARSTVDAPARRLANRPRVEQQRTVPTEPSAQPRAASNSRPTAPPREDTPAAPAAPILPPTIERVTHERTEQHTFRSLIESRIVERITAPPRPARSAPAATTSPIGAPVQAAAAPASPRIEIHIGRIEVMPAAAPVAEPQPIELVKPVPPQSLAAYLSERAKS